MERNGLFVFSVQIIERDEVTKAVKVHETVFCAAELMKELNFEISNKRFKKDAL